MSCNLLNSFISSNHLCVRGRRVPEDFLHKISMVFQIPRNMSVIFQNPLRVSHSLFFPHLLINLLLTLMVMVPRFSSVIQLCPTLCNPMDCSMPGFPVHHQLSEPTQTHVHRVSDAIQPSHPLWSPPSIFPSIRVFLNESVLCIRQPKYWNFSYNISPSNEYSELIGSP